MQKKQKTNFKKKKIPKPFTYICMDFAKLSFLDGWLNSKRKTGNLHLCSGYVIPFVNRNPLRPTYLAQKKYPRRFFFDTFSYFLRNKKTRKEDIQLLTLGP